MRNAHRNRRNPLKVMLVDELRSLLVNSERTDAVHSMLASAVEMAFSIVLATADSSLLCSL